MTNPGYHAHHTCNPCASRLHRDGDLCTHPNSPVYDQPCGPVHTAATRCHVREVIR